MKKNEQQTPYEEAINYLKTSPMFNLSLSSKELFHSNFLYWIWKLDSMAFKCLIAKLLNVSTDDLKWGDSKDWEVVREYKSFDLCVKHCDRTEDVDGKTKIVSGDVLLLLENKVKSIPYKAQLKKYVDKVEKLYGKRRYEEAKKVQYILLTLPTHFPDAPEGIDSEDCNWEVENGYKWKVITYNKYIEKIKSLIDAFTEISDSFNLKEEDKCYVTKIIDDYIKFVEHLLVIYNEWTDKCYDKLGFIYYDKLKQQCSEYKGYITDAQNLRIHDLYHKSKYARICADIISKFSGVLKDYDTYKVGINLTEKEVCKSLENDTGKGGYIVWEYNYTHGEPLVGVKIARRDKDGNLITYIIQAQSGVYEHGVIADHTKLKGEYKGTKDKKLWEYIRNKRNDKIFSVGDYPWLRYEDFADDATKDSKSLSNPEKVLYSDNIFVMDCLYPQCKKQKDTLPYAKYASDNSNTAMIYQFRKLKFEVNTKDLIEYIIKDVKKLLEGLDKQQ
ncbi:MAG: PD-(D/E)XK nuclease family protein [Rikenellaceae bacterium]|nr:PD-(D/E)XK nuclease family protein [Rikenellaceae bacterium]